MVASYQGREGRLTYSPQEMAKFKVSEESLTLGPIDPAVFTGESLWLLDAVLRGRGAILF